MGRWNDDDDPENFREALEMGKLGLWLRNWIILGASAGMLLGLGYLYFQIFPPAHEKPKIGVAEATAQAKAIWDRGDHAGAIAYYRAVAAEGDPAAEYVMGILYQSDKGKLRDDAEAAKWLQKSSDDHYPAAMRELSQLYRDGVGVAKDSARALTLLRAAASAGDANAQTDLGQNFDDGTLGLARDPAQAEAWYGRAAAQGGIVAQVNLSNLLFKGAAGAADAPGAYRWAGVAAAHSEAGTEANRVASSNAAEARAKMTPKQIDQADAWVKSWKAKSP